MLDLKNIDTSGIVAAIKAEAEKQEVEGFALSKLGFFELYTTPDSDRGGGGQMKTGKDLDFEAFAQVVIAASVPGFLAKIVNSAAGQHAIRNAWLDKSPALFREMEKNAGPDCWAGAILRKGKMYFFLSNNNFKVIGEKMIIEEREAGEVLASHLKKA